MYSHDMTRYMTLNFNISYIRVKTQHKYNLLNYIVRWVGGWIERVKYLSREINVMKFSFISPFVCSRIETTNIKRFTTIQLPYQT